MKQQFNLNYFSLLIIFGFFVMNLDLMSQHLLSANSKIPDGVYSDFTEKNGINISLLKKYETSVYGGTKKNANSNVVNNKKLLDFETIYNNSTGRVQNSTINSMKNFNSKTNDTYTFKKLIERQTRVPTTETNPEKFFPAYNQQHKNSKGVQFSEIVTEINDQDKNFDLNNTSYQTYSKNNSPSKKDSFDNVLRRANKQGITNTKMLDKIDSIYFGPNVSKVYENKLEKSTQENIVTEEAYEQPYDKVQVFGSM